MRKVPNFFRHQFASEPIYITPPPDITLSAFIYYFIGCILPIFWFVEVYTDHTIAYWHPGGGGPFLHSKKNLFFLFENQWAIATPHLPLGHPLQMVYNFCELHSVWHLFWTPIWLGLWQLCSDILAKQTKCRSGKQHLYALSSKTFRKHLSPPRNLGMEFLRNRFGLKSLGFPRFLISKPGGGQTKWRMIRDCQWINQHSKWEPSSWTTSNIHLALGKVH